MQCAGICATGKTTVTFIDSGLKINKYVYQKEIIEDVLFPCNKNILDVSARYRAFPSREMAWCRINSSDFISSNEWSKYSCDLNTFVSSSFRSKGLCTASQNLKALKRSLIQEWKRIIPSELLPIAENVPKTFAVVHLNKIRAI